MNVDLSIGTLIWAASLPLQFVLLLLLVASIASWAIIIEKGQTLSHIADQ